MTSTEKRTYRVRTYGCQMNVHDSERLAGLLEDAGYAAATDGDDADVVVLNTCAVRENADNKLYGNLGHLRPVKDARPGMQIAVGGCLAQKDAPPSSTAPPGSTSCSARTTSVRCRPCSSGRGTTTRRRSRSSRPSRSSRAPCRPSATALLRLVSISVGCNKHLHLLHRPALRGKGRTAAR